MLDTAKNSNRIIWLALILLATLAVYSRSLNYGLVNWDEPLSGVRDYREVPGLEGLGDLLKPRISGTYQPVRAVATALLAQYGAKANWVPYHAVSILFYLGTVVFIYLLALVLIRKRAPDIEKAHGVAAALLAAALFALHPSHAEAVAWVTGQKDTFVAFFYLGSLYFYIRHERPGTADYILCLVMFALALGSKPSAVSLPLVLVAYDFTLRSSPGNRRTLGRLWPGYLPFFVPAVAAVVFFVFTTARVGTILPGLGEVTTRLVKMAASVGFSAAKLVLPVNLCLRYPGFEMDVANLSLYIHVLTGLALIAWTIYAVRRGRREAFLLSWFVLALLPNSNLIRINIERADRYYYLSSAAFAILAGWGALELYNRLSRARRATVKWGMLAAVILLGVGSWFQAGYWGSPLKAWTRVFELYPEMPIARLGVASSYLRSGDFDEALRYYRPMLEGAAPNTEAIKGAIFISERRDNRDKALELARLGHMLAPDDEDFMASMTRYHVETGDTAAAALVVGEWLERHPESYEALIEQGNLLWRRGQSDAAEQVFHRVIADYSNYPEVYSALARIKQETGDYTQAEEVLLKGLATGRQSGVLRQQLAGLYEKAGRAEEALEIYSRYEMPDLSMAGLEFMGAYYYSRGDYQRSLEYFQQMARRDPNLPRAYNNSAVVLEDMGRPAESDSLYNLAISLDSNYVDAWFNRGNLAFARGSLDSARQCYLRADSLAGGSDLAVLDALIRVQAAAGDSAAARRTYERAKSSGGGSR